MRRYRFAIAVALTSLALVVGIGVVDVLTVRSVFAGGPWLGGPMGGPWRGGPMGESWHGGPMGGAINLPPELQGLRDLPPAERFEHFTGGQFTLKDKDNNPVTVNVTPGTVTAASATSLTLNANVGTSKTFTLNDQTNIRGKSARGSDQAAQPTLANGDKVVVVSLNNSTTASFVMAGAGEGFGPPWHRR
jgi:hypothetical protein